MTILRSLADQLTGPQKKPSCCGTLPFARWHLCVLPSHRCCFVLSWINTRPQIARMRTWPDLHYQHHQTTELILNQSQCICSNVCAWFAHDCGSSSSNSNSNSTKGACTEQRSHSENVAGPDINQKSGNAYLCGLRARVQQTKREGQEGLWQKKRGLGALVPPLPLSLSNPPEAKQQHLAVS